MSMLKINLPALPESLSIHLTISPDYYVNASALLSNFSVSFSTKTLRFVNLSVGCANTSV